MAIVECESKFCGPGQTTTASVHEEVPGTSTQQSGTRTGSVSSKSVDIHRHKHRKSNASPDTKRLDINGDKPAISKVSVVEGLLNTNTKPLGTRTHVAAKAVDTIRDKTVIRTDDSENEDISDDSELYQFGVECDCGTSYVVYEENIPMTNREIINSVSKKGTDDVKDKTTEFIKNPDRDKNARTCSAIVDTNVKSKLAPETASNLRLLFIGVGSFVLHFCSWGMVKSGGVLYVALLELFGGGRAETTWVFSIFGGVLLLSGPVAGILLRHFGCRLVGVAGSLFMAGGLLASVFTPSLHVLYVTYGIIAGFGGSLLYTTAGIVVLQNFQKRASLILGICASGVSVGNVVIPLITQTSLELYGFRGTFLILCGLCMQCLVMSFTFGADRKSKVTTKPKQRSDDAGWLRSSMQQYCSFFNLGYTMYAISWAFAMLPLLVPFTFLPDVALSRGATKQEAAYIASALGLGSILGKLGFGFLGDMKRVETMLMHIVPIFLFGVINLICVFVEGFVGFVLMATFIGLTASICNGIHAVITLQLVGKEDLSVALGVLYFLMSITTILGTPIAGWIADAAGRYDEPFYYSAVVSFVAALAALYVPFWKRKNRLKTALRQEMTVTP